ncbi:MAG: GerW family sporulation protein [Lachnospiraceae bacterium]|nr:GerW family sporulation protein [Lachnospiraceae bacterium]
MAGNFNEVVDSMLKGMDGFLSSKTVVGEPIVVGEIVIIPLVDVSFGVGAGDFRGEKKANGAGGLTGKMSPSAALVIHNGTTRLVNIKNQDGMTKILDMVPDLVNKFTSKDKDLPLSDEEVKEAAFPGER